MMSGLMVALIVFVGKILELLQNELNDRMVIGGLLLGLGVLFIGTVYYLRSQWKVTEKVD